MKHLQHNIILYALLTAAALLLAIPQAYAKPGETPILAKYPHQGNATYINLRDSKQDFLPGKYEVQAHISWQGQMRTRSVGQKQLDVNQSPITLKPGDSVNATYDLDSAQRIDALTFAWEYFGLNRHQKDLRFTYTLSYQQDNATQKSVYTDHGTLDYATLRDDTQSVFIDEKIDSTRIQDRSLTYLFKRKLGLGGDDTWQKTPLDHNTLLQRRFAHQVKANQFLLISLAQGSSLDNVALSLSQGEPGRVDQVIDLNVSQFTLLDEQSGEKTYVLPLHSLFERKIDFDEPHLAELSVFIQDYQQGSLNEVALFEMDKVDVSAAGSLETKVKDGLIQHTIPLQEVFFDSLQDIQVNLTNIGSEPVTLKNSRARAVDEIFETIPTFVQRNRERMQKHFSHASLGNSTHIHWVSEKYFFYANREKELLNSYLHKIAKNTKNIQNKIDEEIDRLSKHGYRPRAKINKQNIIYNSGERFSLKPSDILYIRDFTPPPNIKCTLSLNTKQGQIDIPIEKDNVQVPLSAFIDSVHEVHSTNLIFAHASGRKGKFNIRMDPPIISIFSNSPIPIHAVFDQPYFKQIYHEPSKKKATLSENATRPANGTVTSNKSDPDILKRDKGQEGNHSLSLLDSTSLFEKYLQDPLDSLKLQETDPVDPGIINFPSRHHDLTRCRLDPLSRETGNPVFWSSKNATLAGFSGGKLPSRVSLSCDLNPNFDYIQEITFELQTPEFITKTLPVKITLSGTTYNLEIQNSTWPVSLWLDRPVQADSIQVSIPTHHLIQSQGLARFSLRNLTSRGRYLSTPLRDIIKNDSILNVNDTKLFLQSRIPEIYTYYNQVSLGEHHFQSIRDIQLASNFFEVDKVVFTYLDDVSEAQLAMLTKPEDQGGPPAPFFTLPKLLKLLAIAAALGALALIWCFFGQGIRAYATRSRAFTETALQETWAQIKIALFKIYTARYHLNAILLLALMIALSYVLLAYRAPNRFAPVLLTLITWTGVCIYIFYRNKILQSISTQALERIVKIRNVIFIFTGLFILIYSTISHIVYIDTKLYTLLLLPFVYLYFPAIIRETYRTFQLRDTGLYKILQNTWTIIRTGWLHAALAAITALAIIQSGSIIIPALAYIILIIGVLSERKQEFIKYSFLIILLLVALSSLKFLSSMGMSDYRYPLTLLAIMFGMLTFWWNRNVLDAVEKEAEEERRAEKLRGEEFDRKYGRFHPPVKYSLWYNFKKILYRT